MLPLLDSFQDSSRSGGDLSTSKGRGRISGTGREESPFMSPFTEGPSTGIPVHVRGPLKKRGESGPKIMRSNRPVQKGNRARDEESCTVTRGSTSKRC